MQFSLKIKSGYDLAAVATEIQSINLFPVNPLAEGVRGFLGDCNTPPDENGFTTVAIAGMDAVPVPEDFTPASFQFVLGAAGGTII